MTLEVKDFSRIMMCVFSDLPYYQVTLGHSIITVQNTGSYQQI